MIRNTLFLLFAIVSGSIPPALAADASSAGESLPNAMQQAELLTAVTMPQASLEKITLSVDALFAFDKATLNPSALWRLDNLAKKFKSLAQLEEVILIGHTDRLRSDGHPERNQSLSEQRAASIKQYLIGKGIAAHKILANGAGPTQPVVQCSTKPSKKKQIACLQPNRRVEIILRGGKAMESDKEHVK
jgi:OOP family OmpA-OmpF porin